MDHSKFPYLKAVACGLIPDFEHTDETTRFAVFRELKTLYMFITLAENEYEYELWTRDKLRVCYGSAARCARWALNMPEAEE